MMKLKECYCFQKTTLFENDLDFLFEQLRGVRNVEYWMQSAQCQVPGGECKMLIAKRNVTSSAEITS